MNIELLNKDIFELAKYNNEGQKSYYFLENLSKYKKIDKNYQEFFYLKTNIDIENEIIYVILYSPFTTTDNDFNTKPLLERIQVAFSNKDTIKNLTTQGLNKNDIQYLNGLTQLEDLNVGCLTGSKFEDKVTGNTSIGGTGKGKKFSVFNYKYAYGKTMFQKPEELNLALNEYTKLLLNNILIQDNVNFQNIKELQTTILEKFNLIYKDDIKKINNFKINTIVSENVYYLLKNDIFKKDILTNIFYNIEIINKNNSLLFKNIINNKEETKEFNDKYIKHKIFTNVIDNKINLNNDVYNLTNLHNIYVDSSNEDRKTFRFFDENKKCKSFKINENILNNIISLNEDIDDKKIGYVYYLKFKTFSNEIKEIIYFSSNNNYYQFYEKVYEEIKTGNTILDVSINKKESVNSFATLIEDKEETILFKNTFKNFYKKMNENIDDNSIFKIVKDYLIEQYKEKLKYQPCKTKKDKEEKDYLYEKLKKLEDLLYSEESLEKLLNYYYDIEQISKEDIKNYFKEKIDDKILKKIYGRIWFNSIKFKQQIIREIKLIPKEDKNRVSFKNSFKKLEKEYLYSDTFKQILKDNERDILKKLSLSNFNYIENINCLYKILYYNNNIKIEYENSKYEKQKFLFDFIKEHYFKNDKSLNILLKEILISDNKKIITIFKNYLYKIHDSYKLNEKDHFKFKMLLKLLNTKDFEEILNKYFLIFLKNLTNNSYNDNNFSLKTYTISFKEEFKNNNMNNDQMNFILGKSIYKIKSCYFNKLGKKDNKKDFQTIDFCDILIEHTNEDKLKNNIKTYLKKYGEYIAKNNLNFDKEFEIIEKFFKNEFKLNKDLFLCGLYGIELNI